MTAGCALPPATGDEATDLAAFSAWEQAAGRARGRLAPSFTYYLGVSEPSWLNRRDGIPKFVTTTRLARYRSTGDRWLRGHRADRWPVSPQERYAVDSGAFMALNSERGSTDAPWFLDDDEYGGMVARFVDDNGTPPDFCAPRDMPCEPPVLRRTGLTVGDHQELSIDSFEALSREFPWLPWIPVLQGWEPEDYVRHRRMYEDRGIDLAAFHRVGVGSICRRGHLPQIVDVITQFAESGIKMHGFGVKVTALPIIGHLLASADSMAWSYGAFKKKIRLPGCEHAGPCNNCYRYAVQWRERVLATMNTPPTINVDEEATVAATTKKITFTQKVPLDGVPGSAVLPGEKFACPVAACGRTAKVKLNGTVGAHTMYGRQRCDLVGQPLPADVPVRVIGRQPVAPPAADMFALMDTTFAELAAQAAAKPAAVRPDGRRSAPPRVYPEYVAGEAYDGTTTVRVDELQGHERVASGGRGIPPLWLYHAPLLVNGDDDEPADEKRYVVEGVRDGERPLERHIMRGSQVVTVVPDDQLGWRPGHFNMIGKPKVIYLDNDREVVGQVAMVTHEWLRVKGRVQEIPYSAVVGRIEHGTELRNPAEPFLSRAMENFEHWYGWEPLEHAFEPTFPGSVRCRCVGSARAPQHTKGLNVDHQAFTEMRMRVLRPGLDDAQRKYAAFLLDLYVRGVPNVQRRGGEYLLSCPHPWCKFEPGEVAPRGRTTGEAREAWFRHCEGHGEKVQWSAAWDDKAWPVPTEPKSKDPAPGAPTVALLDAPTVPQFTVGDSRQGAATKGDGLVFWTVFDGNGAKIAKVDAYCPGWKIDDTALIEAVARAYGVGVDAVKLTWRESRMEPRRGIGEVAGWSAAPRVEQLDLLEAFVAAMTSGQLT